MTDPLDDEAKARIFGQRKIRADHVSSCSKYSIDDLTTSASLSEHFFGFDTDESPREIGDQSCDRDPSMRDSGDSIVDAVDQIKSIVQDQRDFGNSLAEHIMKAAQVFTPLVGSTNTKQNVRQNVMVYLRNCGYTAAICKMKWESFFPI